MDANLNPAAVAEAIAEMRHTELENAVRALIGDREYFNSTDPAHSVAGGPGAGRPVPRTGHRVAAKD